MTDPLDPAETPAGRRRRRRLHWTALILGLTGAWLVYSAVLLLQARRHAADGLAAVSAAERQANPRGLVEGRPTPLLDDARRSFDRAADRLHNPALTPLRWLPIAGRQLRAATAMASAATDITAAGAEAVTDARAALNLPRETPEQRIAMLRRLSDVAAEADRRLARVDLGPSKALVGPVHDKRAELQEKFDKVKGAASDGAVVTRGLADLLEGPRRYVLLAANNAEMRAASGMFLSAGELRVENGRFALGGLRPTGDLGLAAAQAPPIGDDDFAARWGFLTPNREWRNLGLTPRFPASARLAARMWPVATPGSAPPDGVIAIDPVGLRALLKVTGPVGGVTEANVVELLTHDQYQSLPPPSPAFDVVQAARREQLGDIAASVLERLSTGSFDVAVLADALADAAGGRHILGWSPRADDGELWRRGRLDGDLDRDDLVVSVLNRGGNKLDRFLAVSADLGLRPSADDERATVRLTLTNTAPPGQSVYIEGPYPGSGAGAGDYVGIVTVHVPGFAGGLDVEGYDEFTVAGSDGPTQVIGVTVTVPRGESRTLTFTFLLPPRGSMSVVPGARVPAIRWTAPGQSWTGDRSRTIRWE